MGKYIKKVISQGGHLYKFKKVQAYDYRCANKQGLKMLSYLIVNKLRLPRKINQFNERFWPRVDSELCQTNPKSSLYQ